MTKKIKTEEWYECNTSNHQGLIASEESGKDIAVTYAKEDAGHIVACVNACKGINPEGVPKLLEACLSAVRYFDTSETEDDGSDNTMLTMLEFAIMATEE